MLIKKYRIKNKRQLVGSLSFLVDAYVLIKTLGGIVMSPTRQDAWSQDEDLLLAEVVLRHIREGGTQLQAFEEVGKQLSRTSAACGFRWNSYVRKQYKSGIELAKKQRKELKKQHRIRY